MKYLLIHDHVRRSAELHDSLGKTDNDARLYYASTQADAEKILGVNHISIAFVSLRLWHTGLFEVCQGFAPPVILLQGPNTTVKGQILERYPLLIKEPVNMNSVKKAIEKSVALNGRADTHFVTTYDGYEHVGIHVADIEYVTYARHYVGIHTPGTTFIKRISLDKMVKQLSSRPFYIVNPGLALPVDLLAAMDPGVHVIEREMFEYSGLMKKEIDKITEDW